VVPDGTEDSWLASPKVCLDWETSGFCEGVFIQGVQVGKRVCVYERVSAGRRLYGGFNGGRTFSVGLARGPGASVRLVSAGGCLCHPCRKLFRGFIFSSL